MQRCAVRKPNLFVIGAMRRTRCAPRPTPTTRASSFCWILARSHAPLAARDGEHQDQGAAIHVRLRARHRVAGGSRQPGQGREAAAAQCEDHGRGQPLSGYREWTLADAAPGRSRSACYFKRARASAMPASSAAPWRRSSSRAKRARDGEVQIEPLLPMVPQFVQAMERTRPLSLVYLTNALKRPVEVGQGPRQQDAQMVRHHRGWRRQPALRGALAAWWVKTYRCLMAIFGLAHGDGGAALHAGLRPRGRGGRRGREVSDIGPRRIARSCGRALAAPAPSKRPDWRFTERAYLVPGKCRVVSAAHPKRP